MNQQRRDRLKARQDAAEAEYRKANLEKFYDERNAAVHDMQKILSEIAEPIENMTEEMAEEIYERYKLPSLHALERYRWVLAELICEEYAPFIGMFLFWNHRWGAIEVAKTILQIERIFRQFHKDEPPDPNDNPRQGYPKDDEFPGLIMPPRDR